MSRSQGAIESVDFLDARGRWFSEEWQICVILILAHPCVRSDPCAKRVSPQFERTSHTDWSCHTDQEAVRNRHRKPGLRVPEFLQRATQDPEAPF